MTPKAMKLNDETMQDTTPSMPTPPIASNATIGANVDIQIAPARPIGLGAMDVDDHGINIGVLRCRRCDSRLVSPGRGLLTDLSAAVAGVPFLPGPDPGMDVQRYKWWWKLRGTNDFDGIGVSRPIDTEHGAVRFIMCGDCQEMPIGYMLDISTNAWLACERVVQQNKDLANDAEDFQLPPGIDINYLKQLMKSQAERKAKMGEYSITFEEKRLGMVLADVEDGPGVEVVAFTEHEGKPGPAEVSEQIKPGDRIIKVQDLNTEGMDYTQVLTLIVNAPRPITIHFERDANNKAIVAPRRQHEEWVPNGP
uniref:PDZ domain-containing protein n=1 Tax=Eutreptiella gymnastica TaxID=73025 RepID=A0A7S1HWC8_9EUGL